MKTLILAAALSLSATAAFAHAHLLKEMPAANSTGTAPSQLTLGFSEGVLLKFTGVEVTGPDGPLKMGDSALGLGDDKVLIVHFATPPKPGTYTVAWHALSADGHRTQGSYSFTVK